jgi:hypothetical protein
MYAKACECNLEHVSRCSSSSMSRLGPENLTTFRKAESPTSARTMATSFAIFLTLKSVYYLDGKNATLISTSDDTSILAYGKARGD